MNRSPEPALSWFCPDCGHTWISATGQGSSRHRWRCPCGHDTKLVAKRRRNRIDRAKTARRERRVSTVTAGRRELASSVAACRALGMTWRETMAELGISHSYAQELVHDPDGAKAAARKARYRGTCEVCGARTDGSNGRKNAPKRCRRCAPRSNGLARRGTGPLVSEIIRLCAERPRRFTELQQTLGISKGHTGEALHRLVRYGLLRRVKRGLFEAA